jgi:hypothetical protein
MRSYEIANQGDFADLVTYPTGSWRMRGIFTGFNLTIKNTSILWGICYMNLYDVICIL